MKHFRINNQDQSKLFSLIAKKKTKDGFFEISSIVSEIEGMLNEAYFAGINDAIEELQVRDEDKGALTSLYARFFPDRLEQDRNET